METPLDILMKATHYVENQQDSINNGLHSTNSTIRNYSDESSFKENGLSDHVSTIYRSPVSVSEKPMPINRSHKQASSKIDLDQGERIVDKKSEIMRLHYSNEPTSADETITSSQYSRNVSNGLLPRMYSEEKHANLASPIRSSPRKRSSSPSAKNEPEQRAKVHTGQSLNAFNASPTHPVSQLSVNPLMPIINPYLTAATLEPAIYAEAMARQSLINSDVPRPGASPATSTSTPSAIESLSSHNIPRLVYPAFPPNPALLMGTRPPTAPAYPFQDFSMVLPSQLAAAYGQPAGLFPQQLATWPTIEGIPPGLAPGHPFPAQWLANPYLKNFLGATNSDIATNKEANRTVPKAAASTGVGFPNYPYTADIMLKYPNGLAADALKQEIALASRSLSPQRSNSPETVKKPSIPTQQLQYTTSVLNAPYSKSPASDWKISSTSRASKQEPALANVDFRQNSTSRRDVLYGDSHDAQGKAEEAKQKLIGLSHRPCPINEPYTLRYAHERQSPSPYTERWESRRQSRDLSPHLSPANGEKSAKRHSHEGFGIPRDLIPDMKNHSPNPHSSLSGLRHSKTPPKSQSKSPMEPTGQASLANKLFVPPPYVLPSSLAAAGLLSAASYLPEINGPPLNKTVADALTAASLSQVSHLLRPSLPPQESAMNELMLAHQYASYFQPQQLQTLKALTPSSSADYLAVLKQAALQQNLLSEGKQKDDSASPQTSLPYRRYGQNQTSSPSHKMPCVSPVPQPNKAALRNPSPAFSQIYKPQSLISDNRNIKRESASPSVKFTASTVPNNPQIVAKTSTGTSEAIKRRVPEELNERNFKETSTKRKREQTTAVDEHFRRSLGPDYKPAEVQNKVHTTGSVEDHFQKVFGKNWDKIKSNKRTSSPQSHHVLPNGKETRPHVSSGPLKGSPQPPGLPSYPSNLLYPGMSIDPQLAARQLLLNNAVKSAKAAGVVQPETTIDSPKTHGVVEKSSRCPPAFYPDARTLLPAYEAASRLHGETKDPITLRSTSSPAENLSKNPPQNYSPHTPTPPNTSNKAQSVLEGSFGTPSSRAPHSVQASNGLIKSPTKPPPAYSPQSNTSAASLPTSASPKSTIDPQSSGDSNLVVPMSVTS